MVVHKFAFNLLPDHASSPPSGKATAVYPYTITFYELLCSYHPLPYRFIALPVHFELFPSKYSIYLAVEAILILSRGDYNHSQQHHWRQSDVPSLRFPVNGSIKPVYAATSHHPSSLFQEAWPCQQRIERTSNRLNGNIHRSP